MTEQALVTVVLVNYNTKELVRRQSEQFLDNEVPVVVVNNSESSIEADLPNEVRYIEAKQNDGYTGGNNLGIRACNNHSDYVLVLNPDTEIDPSVLTELVKSCESIEELGIISPVVINPSSNVSEPSEDIREFLLRKVQVLPELPADDELVRYRSSVPGCVMLIDVSVHQDLAGFDDRFFMYQDEVDYCYRAQKNGYSIATHKSVTAIHGDESEDFPKDKDYRLYYYLRNGFLLSHTAFSGTGTALFLGLHMASLLRKFVYILIFRRLDLLPAFGYAVFDGIRGNYGRSRFP